MGLLNQLVLQLLLSETLVEVLLSAPVDRGARRKFLGRLAYEITSLASPVHLVKNAHHVAIRSAGGSRIWVVGGSDSGCRCLRG